MRANRKSILLLLIIIIVIICIVLLSIILNRNSDKKTNTNNKDIIKEEKESKLVGMNKTIMYNIDNKIDTNIYFTDNSEESKYYDSKVDMFKKLYDVKIETYNISKEGKKNLNILTQKFGYEKSFIAPTSFLFIKNGKYTCYSNFYTESDLYNYFNREKLLGEDAYNMYITTEEIFDELYNSKDKQLIIVSLIDKSNYKYRLRLNKIAKDYNFKYYVAFYHIAGTFKADKIIDEDLDGKINVPAILVVKEGKVLNYTDSTKEESIKKFLKKNGFIK